MYSDASGQQTPPVVAGVDGSRTGPAVVDLAAGEADRQRAPLMIVNVWPGRYPGGLRGRGALTSKDDVRRLLDVSAGRARHLAPGVDVTTRMLEGGAANVLTRCSERARLVVVGHRHDVVTRPSWGSTAAYLAHHSASPVLIHRGAAPRQGPVVVAVSARGAGTATLGYAFAQAALLGSRLVAVHMWSRVPGAVRPPIGAPLEQREAEQALAEELAVWTARFPDVPIDRLLVADTEFEYTLERASRRGRLLVAGIGRSGSFAEFLYGSLGAGGRTRRMMCPVALVPPAWPTRDQVATDADPLLAQLRTP